MKNNFFKYILGLSLVCSLFSCGKETSSQQKPTEKPAFELVGKAPIVAYPDDNVRYHFAVSYPEGLKSVGTYVDGSLVEGSLVEYEDGPDMTDYNFSYSFMSEQVGQTIDFVFVAEGTDGIKSSVDYPVYVRSISETVTVTLPDALESEAVIGDKIEFDVIVATGYPLAKIRTLKNGIELAELTKTGNFHEPKADIYHFSYLLPKSDGGSVVKFTFEGTDSKGNFGTAEYQLYVRKGQPKVLYTEVFDTQMRISNTSEFDTSVGGITGTSASEFVPGNIARYSGADPEVTEGVKAGLAVFDGDKTSVNYSSDGVEVCLTKYNYSAMKLISGTYVWARKAKKGWIAVSGIKLHGCTSLALSYLQCGGAVKVEWSSDGEKWAEICKSSVTDEQRADFTVPEGTESISLKFSENAGAAHLRFDNISLKGE